jgi:hypothetical protein
MGHIWSTAHLSILHKLKKPEKSDPQRLTTNFTSNIADKIRQYILILVYICYFYYLVSDVLKDINNHPKLYQILTADSRPIVILSVFFQFLLHSLPRLHEDGRKYPKSLRWPNAPFLDLGGSFNSQDVLFNMPD